MLAGMVCCKLYGEYHCYLTRVREACFDQFDVEIIKCIDCRRNVFLKRAKDGYNLILCDLIYIECVRLV
jgi:hypothetical protein